MFSSRADAGALDPAPSSPSVFAAAAQTVRVRGLPVTRLARWVPVAAPLYCPADSPHLIGGTWGTHRGALKCRHGDRQDPRGRANHDCGRYIYVLTVRELRRRLVVEVTREEALWLDTLSECGVLAFFRQPWPSTSDAA